MPRELWRIPEYDLTRQFPNRRFEHLNGLFARMIVESGDERFLAMSECRAQMDRALASIRQGIPCREGMYGGATSASERYVLLHTSLTALHPLAQKDSLLDAGGEAREVANRIVTNAQDHARPERGDASAASLIHSALLIGEQLSVAVFIPIETLGSAELRVSVFRT